MSQRGNWVLEWRRIDVPEASEFNSCPFAFGRTGELSLEVSSVASGDEEKTPPAVARQLQWHYVQIRRPLFASAALNHHLEGKSTTTTASCAGIIEGGEEAPSAAAASEAVNSREGEEEDKKSQRQGQRLPPLKMLLRHPLALLGVIPKDVSLFFAGAFAGAAAKTVTAPLDRIKLLMQTHGLRAVEESARRGIGFIEAVVLIGKEEGVKGYWKGNLPQVIRIIPYSAAQLFAYEVYKKLFKGEDKELSVLGRLAAGACAGMTSTLVTYPLDVLRLRLAVEPGCISMSQVAMNMLRDEGFGSFYNGLGPSLLGIAPYIAVNFCIFDMVKKSLPEKYQNRPESSLVTALVSATFATLTCYPLDTVRRQMQMKGSPFNTVLDAIPGIIEREGFLGLYRGFVPNALKNLPNSSIRLTTFDTAKRLISAGKKELHRMIEENREKLIH